jgi:hypothetical protein
MLASSSVSYARCATLSRRTDPALFRDQRPFAEQGRRKLQGIVAVHRFRTSAKMAFDQRRAEKMAREARMHVRDPERSHLKVYLGGKQTVLPMHPKKELKTGTVEGIKKRLGLK